MARLAETPLLAVVGPSGSGKSSLVRAGLLPALGYESVLIRPGTEPVALLATALAGVAPGERLVLAVDQFEELFAASVAENERRGFIDSLVEAAWDADRRVLVVIALRADFFGRLAAYVELADLVGPNHALLGPMSPTELRRAIQGPAERTGLEVEPALVDALVDEVAGEAGGLPLLSTALLDLWREREDHSLTLAAYARTGGVRGAIGRHAEAAFRSLSEDEQQVARRMLLRLVAGGDGEPLTRRRVTRSELDADDDERVLRVLAALVERRLLVVDDGTVELVHEALLERWQRLVDWLEEDVQGRLQHRHLTLAATEWEAAGRDPSALYRGARLTGALDWATEHAPDLNQLERHFLDESQAASLHEASRQRRTNRRLRALLVVTVALLALSALAAAFALEKRGQARRDATAAVAQRLGAQALIDPNLDRSLLLAREGMNLDDSEATRSNLLAALLRIPNAIWVVHEGSDRVLDEALSPDGRTLAIRGSDGNVALLTHGRCAQSETSLPATTRPAWLRRGRSTRSLSARTQGRSPSAAPREPAIEHRDSRSCRGSHMCRRRKRAWASRSQPMWCSRPTAALLRPAGLSAQPAHQSEVIVVRDVRTGVARARTRPIPGGRLAGYTHGGRFLLVVAGKGRSLLYNARTLKLARTFEVGGTACPVAGVKPSGVWSRGRQRHPPRPAHRRNDDALRAGERQHRRGQLQPRRRPLASADEDGTISVWNVRTGALRETFKGHSAAALAAVFSPDGRTLYTAGDDGSVIVWDLGGARRLGKPFRYSSLTARLDRIGREPERLALRTLTSAGSRHSLARGYSYPSRAPAARTGRQRPGHRLQPGRKAHRSRRQSPRSALGHDDAGRSSGSCRSGISVRHRWHSAPTASPWRSGAPTASTLSTTSGRAGRRPSSSGFAALRISTSARTGSCSRRQGLDGTATVWDVARQSVRSSLQAHVPSYAVRFSPDGKLVAVGDTSGERRLWKLDPGHQFQGVWAPRRVGSTACRPQRRRGFDRLRPTRQHARDSRATTESSASGTSPRAS